MHQVGKKKTITSMCVNKFYLSGHIERGIGKLECVCACVCVCACLRVRVPVYVHCYVERGFSILTSFHVVPIQHTSLVCLRMFQTQLHFDKTGVRVVAICPGYTVTNILGGENKFLVAEWKDLKKIEFQP